MKNKPVTLEDVARLASVSKSTVSYVLRQGEHVSDRTRERVTNAAKSLGYIVDRRAAALRGATNQTVGLLVPDLSNSFYTSLLRGIDSTLSENNHTILVGTSNESLERQERVLENMLENRVRCIILFAAAGTTSHSLYRIEKLGVHLILINRSVDDKSFDFFGINDVLAGHMAAKHLIHQGAKSIAFLGGKNDLPSRRERLQGVHTALAEFKQATLVCELEATPVMESGYYLVHRLLTKEKLPHGLICYNDATAIGVMKAMESKGIKVGKDILVIGMDAIPEGELTSPSLTTISTFPYDRGVLAAKRLLEHQPGSTSVPLHTILDPALIVRASSRKKLDFG